jgi:hypothetical protein
LTILATSSLETDLTDWAWAVQTQHEIAAKNGKTAR